MVTGTIIFVAAAASAGLCLAPRSTRRTVEAKAVASREVETYGAGTLGL
ncbi:hypothetical protein [Jannaschia aquimarina]|uniref:Uncharacterized protein n=1 Tax=Jannaschia aquimarina TaxID=935700 RepID=A0A0D1EE42_9RHOB|nr:hypothetical protein [Jannaschia aquimarina]KIT15959.1 hypothetical protein jaqu_22280 [Jannaschia aquimarina]SNS98711.1 hypothetical protein SAMN05421775_104139 [Jannaschia aquimarina]